MNTIKFEALNLSNDVLKAVLDMGFSQTTPIQAQAIPEIIAGHDVIGQASTGTGKTAAFGIPAIEKIDPQHKAVQILALCPTRELAIQVSGEITKLLKYKRAISALPVYGGQPIERQFAGLRRGPQIVIGTPGRILDHLDRGTLRLDNVSMVILDEADKMLDMGFRPDIEQILRTIPRNRQTVLFSATMSSEILQLTKRYQNNPKMIKVAPEKLSIPPVEQIYFDVEQSKKTQALIQLLDIHNPRLAIVFCNTKRKVDNVSRILRDRGYQAAGIHGDIRQSKRDSIMTRFRNDKINILVATDVAARGIDVANVEIVFNYEIPQDVESYIHRIGRTGRAGKTGKALSLVSGREMGQLRDIKRYTKATINQQYIPTFEQVKSSVPVVAHATKTMPTTSTMPTMNTMHAMNTTNNINDRLEQQANKILGHIKQNLNRDQLTDYLHLMKKHLGEKHSSTDIAAALLKLVIDADHHKTHQNNVN